MYGALERTNDDQVTGNRRAAGPAHGIIAVMPDPAVPLAGMLAPQGVPGGGVERFDFSAGAGGIKLAVRVSDRHARAGRLRALADPFAPQFLHVDRRCKFD